MVKSTLGRECRSLQTPGNAKAKEVLAYILRTIHTQGMSMDTGAGSRERLMPDVART